MWKRTEYFQKYQQKRQARLHRIKIPLPATLAEALLEEAA
jgi:hypothetical protein